MPLAVRARRRIDDPLRRRFRRRDQGVSRKVPGRTLTGDVQRSGEVRQRFGARFCDRRPLGPQAIERVGAKRRYQIGQSHRAGDRRQRPPRSAATTRSLHLSRQGRAKRPFCFAPRRLGSPAELVLRVTNAAGSQVGQAEAVGSVESTLPVTFPSDGDYVLEVRELNHRGGPRYVYHVEVLPSGPPFTLSAKTDSLNVPLGGTAVVTVTAVRLGYTGPISVRAEGLPAGITSVPTTIGAVRPARRFRCDRRPSGDRQKSIRCGSSVPQQSTRPTSAMSPR